MQNIEKVIAWFGNRGIEVKKSHLKKWLILGDRLYWVPNNDKCAPEISTDIDGNVNCCSMNSLCFEIQDEMPFENSPLKHSNEHKNKPVSVEPDRVQLVKAIMDVKELQKNIDDIVPQAMKMSLTTRKWELDSMLAMLNSLWGDVMRFAPGLIFNDVPNQLPAAQAKLWLMVIGKAEKHIASLLLELQDL
jgi:hypothetical protein